MKKYLSAAILVLTLNTQAQAYTVTEGCYFTNSDPYYCSTQIPICTFNFELDKLKFGYSVAKLCSIIDTVSVGSDSFQSSLNQCNSNLGAVQNSLNEWQAYGTSLKASYEALATNYNSLAYDKNNIVTRYKALEKKLRVACGTKCKKIKY